MECSCQYPGQNQDKAFHRRPLFAREMTKLISWISLVSYSSAFQISAALHFPLESSLTRSPACLTYLWTRWICIWSLYWTLVIVIVIAFDLGHWSFRKISWSISDAHNTPFVCLLWWFGKILWPCGVGWGKSEKSLVDQHHSIKRSSLSSQSTEKISPWLRSKLILITHQAKCTHFITLTLHSLTAWFAWFAQICIGLPLSCLHFIEWQWYSVVIMEAEGSPNTVKQ